MAHSLKRLLYAQAKAFLESACTLASPGYIHPTVMCELVWVLKAAYQRSKEEIVSVLEHILKTRQFEKGKGIVSLASD